METSVDTFSELSDSNVIFTRVLPSENTNSYHNTFVLFMWACALTAPGITLQILGLETHTLVMGTSMLERQHKHSDNFANARVNPASVLMLSLNHALIKIKSLTVLTLICKQVQQVHNVSSQIKWSSYYIQTLLTIRHKFLK